MAKKTRESGATVQAQVHRDIRRERAQQYVSLYANDIQLQASPWDMRFLFGEASLSDDEDGLVVVKQLAEVRVSPPMAKKLSAILAAQIANYEANFGSIPLKEG